MQSSRESWIIQLNVVTTGSARLSDDHLVFQTLQLITNRNEESYRHRFSTHRFRNCLFNIFAAILRRSNTECDVSREPGAHGVYETQGVQRLHGVKWKFKTERIIEAWFSSLSVADEVVYFGSDDGYLYAVNALTGALKWKFKTGDVVYSSPAIADGAVYIDSHDGCLYAVDAKTGDERWKFRTGYRVYSSPAVSNGIVYFGSADSYLYAVDAATGKLFWKFKAGGWILSSPAIADGTVYFGCWDAYLYAVDIGQRSHKSRRTLHATAFIAWSSGARAGC